MSAWALALCAFIAAPNPNPKGAVKAPETWPRALVERIEVPVPPGFDRELRPLGAHAAMLTLTDGTDSVVVTVYSEGAPEALRVHREELQRALGAGLQKPARRLFLGKRRASETLSAHYLGADVVAEVVAADLGARTVVATIVRVADGPNANVLDRVVSSVKLARTPPGGWR